MQPIHQINSLTKKGVPSNSENIKITRILKFLSCYRLVWIMRNEIIYLFIVAEFLILYHDAILRYILLRLVMDWVFPISSMSCQSDVDGRDLALSSNHITWMCCPISVVPNMAPRELSALEKFLGLKKPHKYSTQGVKKVTCSYIPFAFVYVYILILAIARM